MRLLRLPLAEGGLEQVGRFPLGFFALRVGQRQGMDSDWFRIDRKWPAGFRQQGYALETWNG